MVTVIACTQRAANERKFAPIFNLYGVRINGDEHRIISTSSVDAQLWALDYCEKNNIHAWTISSWRVA